MLVPVLATVGAGLVAFLGYVSTRPSTFRYERSGVINAAPSKLFPYLSNFRRGAEWSPYEKKDPQMKKNFIGPDAQVGSAMEFDGNRESGSGKLEILTLIPNELVEVRLTMTKPMKADNIVRYKLTPEGNATRFSWEMTGDCGFLSKLLMTLMDLEKMVAGDFTVGIDNLKKVVESQG